MMVLVIMRPAWEGQGPTRGSPAELDTTGTVTSRFIYGSRAHVPDTMLQGDNTYGFVTDPRGSVRLVVNTSTGEVAQRIDYGPFGEVLSDTNPGFQPFGFAGGLYDADTGLVRFGARDYDAGAGRWVSKDPIGFGGARSNLYVYVGNDPVNQIDPTGLFDFWGTAGKIWATQTTLVGLAIGGAGRVLGGQAPTIGNNAIEFRGNRLIAPFTPAITFGNVICYADISPRRSTQAHELQHTFQGEVLGPAYLPAHIAFQALGFAYSFFDPTRTYVSINDRVHSPANLLEVGPDSNPRRPWP